MANFIGLVYATLKNEGVDTSGMSTDEAVAKFKELQKKSGGESGEKGATPAEQRKLKQKGVVKDDKSINNEKSYNKVIDFVDNKDIDWDLAEKNEKINAKNSKNPNRTNRYGDNLLSDEAFNIGVEAGKSYLDYMTQYNDLSKLKTNNVFLGYMSEIIGNAITNNGFNPNQDITYTDFNEILGNIFNEEIDLQKYELREGSGFTGRNYMGYKPNNK